MWVCVLFLCLQCILHMQVCISERRGGQQKPGTWSPAYQVLMKGTDGALRGLFSAWSSLLQPLQAHLYPPTHSPS